DPDDHPVRIARVATPLHELSQRRSRWPWASASTPNELAPCLLDYDVHLSAAEAVHRVVCAHADAKDIERRWIAPKASVIAGTSDWRSLTSAAHRRRKSSMTPASHVSVSQLWSLAG